jgi:hypothetical protein
MLNRGKLMIGIAFGILLGSSALVRAADVSEIAAVQRALASRGYNVGIADGVLGPQTRSAIRAFEVDQGLPVTGLVSDALVRKITIPRVMAPIPHQILTTTRPSTEATSDTLNTPSKLPLGLSEQRGVLNRSWMVRDFDQFGLVTGPVFSVFLGEGGQISGPRFSANMRWSLSANDGVVLVYENMLGMKIERNGRLVSPDHIEGHATGADGESWKWDAAAKPVSGGPGK